MVGIATFVILSTMRPLYTSEARILIENDVSPFTRAATDDRNAQRANLNEQAVESQVQVLTSRDLALEVVKQLDLVNNRAFAKDAGTPLLARLLDRFGLGGSDKSKEEKAADAFEEHLSVYVLTKSNVIAVNYTVGRPAACIQSRQYARRGVSVLATPRQAPANEGRHHLAQLADRGVAQKGRRFRSRRGAIPRQSWPLRGHQ